MAGNRDRIELFELLDRRRAGDDEPRRSAPPPACAGYSDLVIGMDTAFVIFAGMLMLLASAYYLGYRRGQVEREAGGMAARGGVSLPLSPAPEARRGIEGAAPPPALVITGKEYTLKLRSCHAHTQAALDRLRLDAAHVRARVLRALGASAAAPVLIFDNGKVYSLGAGLSRERNAPLLMRLRSLLNDDPGPPTSGRMPYRGCAVAKTAYLGKVVKP